MQVYIGDTVYWFPGGAKYLNPHSATVLSVSHSSVHLKVDAVDTTFRVECVRHIEDPSLKDSERKDSGAWEHREVVIDANEKAAKAREKAEAAARAKEEAKTK